MKVKKRKRTNYIYLLRAMRAGDVLYIPEHMPRLDREIVSAINKYGGRATTACFVAVNLDPTTAHRVIRIEMRAPMRALYKRGRKPRPK